MKKTFAIVLLAIMLISIAMGVCTNAAEEKVTVLLDGVEIFFPDAQPFIDARDRTLVPIRFVSEAMGAEVSWINETREVVIAKDNDIIRYKIGDMKAYLNNEIKVFDSYGILKEDRTFVPLRFISEMLSCNVTWNDGERYVKIISPNTTEKFPEPVLKINYPDSESDKRLFWITIDNYRDFERECPYYEFKVEFINPTEFNSFEQDEGAVNGWQEYRRDEFVYLTSNNPTVVSVNRAYYTTREYAKEFKPCDGDEIEFKLTVHRKCSDETREYVYKEQIKLPYALIETED